MNMARDIDSMMQEAAVKSATSELMDDLADARKVRDEWCAEYTRVRNELDAVKKDLEFYREHYLHCA